MDFLTRLAATTHSWYASFLPTVSLRNILIFSVIILIIGASYIAFAAPIDFPAGTIVNIAPGTSLPEAASELAEAHVIAHPIVLRAILRLSGESGDIKTGAYRFNEPEDIFTVADRLVNGSYGLPMKRITFVEGVTIREISDQVAAAFPNISTNSFLAVTKGQEGYLFPDTYFFVPSADATTVMRAMRANFSAKITSLSEQIAVSGHSTNEILTMASLIEKEARTDNDRRMISGILWSRIDKGMPLQVDAVFGYIFGRDTYSPSLTDLRVDSPYNTYVHKGLPPSPINNPGLDAIEAALNPTPSGYLYYLTDHNSVMHYATTYAIHKANERKYLKQAQ